MADNSVPSTETGHEPRVVLDELVSGIRSTLEQDLVAVYLYGSYVTGGYDEGVSDLDLVAVTGVAADRLDLVAIGAMHDQLVVRHPNWADRIEVVYIDQDSLATFRTSRARLAVISPGEPLHLRTEPPRDWVQNWYLARETGVRLFGRQAESVIPPIRWSEFVAASRRYAAELASSDMKDASPGHLAYNVLTMCRLQRTIEVGDSVTKQAAAAWARARYAESAWLIDAALECRRSRGSIGFRDAAIRSSAIAFVRHVGRDFDSNDE